MVKHLKAGEYAEQIGVAVDTVYGWIQAGDLRAVNVGGGRRPTWRIPLDATHDFERSRSNTPPTPATRRRSRRSSGDVKEFV